MQGLVKGQLVSDQVFQTEYEGKKGEKRILEVLTKDNKDKDGKVRASIDRVKVPMDYKKIKEGKMVEFAGRLVFGVINGNKYQFVDLSK